MKQVRNFFALVFGVFLGINAMLGSPALAQAEAPVVKAATATDFRPKLVTAASPTTVNGITCQKQLDGVLPTSASKAKFSPWKVMNPHTFKDGASSYSAQCRSTIGVLPWLTTEVCKDFEQALKEGRCAVVTDVNYIDLDVVRGRRAGKSVAFTNQAMQLGEERWAIFVEVPDQKWLGVFAGQPGKSCNNFFAVDAKPARVKVTIPPPQSGGTAPAAKQPEPSAATSSQGTGAPVVKKSECPKCPQTPPPPTKVVGSVQPVAVVATAISPEHYMVHTGWVESNISHRHVPGIATGGAAVAGQVIVIDNGLQNSGQTKVDW